MLPATDIHGEPHFEIVEEMGVWADMPQEIVDLTVGLDYLHSPEYKKMARRHGPGMDAELSRAYLRGNRRVPARARAARLDDPYARAQVAAAIELLGNLATRVEWRADQLAEEVSGSARCSRPRRPAPASSTRTFRRPRDLLASRQRHLDALVVLQEGAEAAAVDDELRAFSAWQLDRELALLRTGMYK